MEAATSNGPSHGQPRTPSDAAALRRYDARMSLPIVLAALLPLVIVPTTGDWLGVVVGVTSWVVFLVDFVVHNRRLDRYLGTWPGRFDLLIVIVTAPWFLLPGAGAGSWVLFLRLARLARVVMATHGARRLFIRIGRVAVVAVGVVVVGAVAAYRAEHPTNPEFATYGDALWWAIVTLTTVGYGDIVPMTAAGRWDGVAIMVTGIGVLGLLAGSLASFFRPSDNDGAQRGDGPDDRADAGESAQAALAREVADLRASIALLNEWLAQGPAGRG